MSSFWNQVKLAAETAIGLPDPTRYGSPEDLSAGDIVPFVVQKHVARRAGEHRDVRMGKDMMQSWAFRKGMPAPGKTHLGTQQPLHEESYKTFQGEIPEGYGAGEVSTEDLGEVVVLKSTPRSIRFATAHSRRPQVFSMVKTDMDGKSVWLMRNVTPDVPPDFKKRHYLKIPSEEVDRYIKDPGKAFSEKLDGALNIVRLMRNGAQVMSYRTGSGGAPIVHTERLQVPETRIPKKLEGMELVGEVWGEGPGGKAIPPQELGGILNSVLGKALRRTRENRVKLRMALFGVKGMEDAPLADVRSRIQEAMEYLPGDIFHEPQYAYSEKEKTKMWRSVTSGENPRTSEGVVVFPVEGGVPSKIKPRPDFDVHVRKIFSGSGKYTGTHAGGFSYSLEAGGPEVGRVGTGISDAVRKSMMEHPEEFEGRVARVTAQGRFPSGALRAPSFIALHEG